MLKEKYDLPGDDGKFTRYKQFKELLNVYQEQDISACALRAYADMNKLDGRQRVWLSFLYSTCYDDITAIIIFQRFPELTTAAVNQTSLTQFWDKNKPVLRFGRDRRYLWNMNTWVAAVLSFVNDMSYNPETIIRSFGSDKYVTGDSMYKRMKANWSQFGAMGAFLFLDALREIDGSNKRVDVTKLPWGSVGDTVWQGLCHMLYLDDLCLLNWGDVKIHVPQFNDVLENLRLDTGTELTIIESTLCMYRKLYKGSRYYGYYADRHLESVEFYKNKCMLDFPAYAIREKLIPAKYRGEDGGWSGVRKYKCDEFLRTGQIFTE